MSSELVKFENGVGRGNIASQEEFLRECIIDGGFSQWALRKNNKIMEGYLSQDVSLNFYISFLEQHNFGSSSKVIVILEDGTSLGNVVVSSATDYSFLATYSWTFPGPKNQKVLVIADDNNTKDIYDFSSTTSASWAKSGSTTITITATTYHNVLPGQYVSVWYSDDVSEFPWGVHQVDTIVDSNNFTIEVPSSGTASGNCWYVLTWKPKRINDIFFGYGPNVTHSGKDLDVPNKECSNSVRLLDVVSSRVDYYIGQAIESRNSQYLKGKRVSLSAYVKTDGVIPQNTIKYRFRSSSENEYSLQDSRVGGISVPAITSITGHMTGAKAVSFLEAYPNHVDLVTINSLAGLANDFTISFWVYCDSTQSASNGCVINWHYAGQTAGWYISHDPTTPTLFFLPVESGLQLTAGATEGFAQDTWVYVTLSKSSVNGTKLYIDGVLADSDATDTSTMTNPTHDYLMFGDIANGLGSYMFKGNLEDVRLYKRELTSTEVLELYNDTSSSPLNDNQIFHTECNMWIKCNEDAGYNLLDSGPASFGSYNDGSNLLRYEDNFRHKSPLSLTENPVRNTGIAHAVISSAATSPAFGVSGRLPSQTCVEFTAATPTRLDTGIPPTAFWNNKLAYGFTFSCWVKFKTLGVTEPIITDYSGSYNEYIYICKDSSDNIQVQCRLPNASGQFVATVATVTTGVWYHITIVNSPYSLARRMQIYINGVQQALSILQDNSGGTDSLGNANSVFMIGDQISLGQPLDGYLEDLRVYNTALSTENIQEMYNDTLVTPYATDQSFNILPIHQWKFDEAVGSTYAIDYAPKWHNDYDLNKVEGTFVHEQINNNWVKITAENILLPDTMRWEQGMEVNIILPKNSMAGRHYLKFSGIHMNEGTKDTGFVPKTDLQNLQLVERFYIRYFLDKFAGQLVFLPGTINSSGYVYAPLKTNMLKYPYFELYGGTSAVLGVTSMAVSGANLADFNDGSLYFVHNGVGYGSYSGQPGALFLSVVHESFTLDGNII